MKECKYCGKEFLPSRRKVFCSHKCWKHHYYENGGRPVYDRKCEDCGIEFSTTDKRKIYCSPKCNEKAQNKKRKTTKLEIRTCPHCGTNFRPMQKRGKGRKYCTDKCKDAARYQRLKPQKSEYRKEQDRKYKWDGNWWKALQRDKFTCQLCGLKSCHSQWKGKRKLMVHHRDGTGESKEKNHSLDNLMTVCQPCHHKFHHLHLILEDGEYKIAGEIFKEIPLDQLKTTQLKER